MRPPSHPATLRDPVADASLRTEGYVVIDLLDETELAELTNLFRTLHREPRSTWESDFYDPDPQVKRTAHEGIGATFARAMAERFTGHRSLLHNFVINWPGTDGGLVLHQHSSVVDESKRRSVIVWCALNTATEENGTLHVVPRSHLVQVGPRPERSPDWYAPHHDVLLRDHLVSVTVEPGQALVFDNQLLHCSFANSTDEARVTAAAVVVPADAEPHFYEWDGADTTRVYRLDPEFFLTHEPGELQWSRPEGLELLREEAWAPTVVSAADVERLLPRGTCEHAR